MDWKSDEYKKEIPKLVQIAQNGTDKEKREAWSRLYEEHRSSLFIIAKARVKDHELAQDIVQETFAKAIKGIRTWRDTGISFFSWLCAIERNIIRDHYKSKNTYTYLMADITVLDQQDLTVEANPEKALIRKDLERAFAMAMIELTPDQQRVIHFRYFEGLSVEETAIKMDKPQGSIKALTFRAVRRLEPLVRPYKKHAL